MTEVNFHLVKFSAILDQIEERKHFFIFFTTTKNSYPPLIHSAYCSVVYSLTCTALCKKNLCFPVLNCIAKHFKAIEEGLIVQV